jgi:hypothetical protein
MGCSWIEVVEKAKVEGIALEPVYKTEFVYSEPDEAYWNTGGPWSESEVQDIRYAAEHGETLEEVSVFLMRTPADVLAKATELSLRIRQK